MLRKGLTQDVAGEEDVDVLHDEHVGDPVLVSFRHRSEGLHHDSLLLHAIHHGVHVCGVEGVGRAIVLVGFGLEVVTRRESRRR